MLQPATPVSQMRHVEKSDIVVTASDSRVPDEACTVCSNSRAVGVQTRKPRLRGGRRDGERWNMTDIVVSLVCHARSRHATRPAGCWEWGGGGDGMKEGRRREFGGVGG